MFREDKTTQMAARFLALAGGSLPCVLLMKLLYIADKQMLVQWGKPMTYDRWYSMPPGPVLGATLRLIQSSIQSATEPPTYWAAHIETEGDDVVLKVDPGNDDLSRAEEAVVEQTYRDWCHKDWRDAGNWRDAGKMTPGFPDSREPGALASPISYAMALEISGFSREAAAGILDAIEMQEEAAGLSGTLTRAA